MLITELHEGSGLGNQLWNYVVTRTIAYNKGYYFGIMGKEQYKGKNIIDIDFGGQYFSKPFFSYQESLVRNEIGIDITPPDKNLINIKDNTKISGIMQSMSYIKEHKILISDWLTIKIEKKTNNFSSDDICICHLRGGDYRGCSANSLMQPIYYKRAMDFMKQKNPNMKFYLISDDANLAKLYAGILGIDIIGSMLLDNPDPYKASHHIGGNIEIDYAILNSAKNVIISNSTFAFWPVWTNKNNPYVIAPYRWFAHNLDGDFWSTGDMKVDEWNYIDKNGIIYEN